MRQIRYGVFETNSSSMHSIVVTKDDKPVEHIEQGYGLNDIYLNSEGKYCVGGCDSKVDFERYPFEVLYSPAGRARYAIASYAYNVDIEDKVEEIESIIRSVMPEFKGFEFDKYTYWDTDEEEIHYGHVDHQSSGLLQNFLSERNVSLRDFILNDKYWVIIDGDEYCLTNDYLDNKVLNKDYIVEVFNDGITW